MRGVNLSSPRNRETAHRALAAREPVRLARPLRGAAPYTLLRDASKNTVYSSLALKPLKNVSKTEARMIGTQNANFVKNRNIICWWKAERVQLRDHYTKTLPAGTTLKTDTRLYSP